MDLEQLAAGQHAIWAHWMRYLFGCCVVNADGSCTIPADKVTRWRRLMTRPYSALSEREKQSDRAHATTVLQALQTPPRGALMEASERFLRHRLREEWTWLRQHHDPQATEADAQEYLRSQCGFAQGSCRYEATEYCQLDCPFRPEEISC